MKTAIVSGANGFVGNAVIKELLSNHYSVQGLFHNDVSRLENHPRLKLVKYSADKVNLLNNKLESSDIFYHFAWRGISGPERYDYNIQLQNIKQTIEILKMAKKIGCRRFVCAGSIVEYEALAAAHVNGNRPGTEYVYGAGKLAAHMMCKYVASEIGIDLLWGVITNTYGPGEISKRLVNTTLRKLINGEIPKFTSATQNYDFVYIDDVARAFRLIGERGVPFSEYIIGSSNPGQLKTFLSEMNHAVSPNIHFEYGDISFTGVGLPIEIFDCSKTEVDTGFKADVPFGEGVLRTFNWLKNHAPL